MRCGYCGARVKRTDIVCKGCSAPVSEVNRASNWAMFFGVVSLLGSCLSVYNQLFLVLGLILIIAGFHLAKKREGKGKTTAVVALVFWILGLLATAGVTIVYIVLYHEVLHTVYVLLPTSISQLFEEWFGFLGGLTTTL